MTFFCRNNEAEMKRTKTGLLLAGVLSLLLWPACTAAQETSWEKYNVAGMEAYQQGRYGEAEKRWLAALEEAENFGPDDQRLATSLNNLAALYYSQGNYAESEPLFKRSLAIREKALGPGHLDVVMGLQNYAELLRKTNREAEAEKLEVRAQAIRTKHAQENPPK